MALFLFLTPENLTALLIIQYDLSWVADDVVVSIAWSILPEGGVKVNAFNLQGRGFWKSRNQVYRVTENYTGKAEIFIKSLQNEKAFF